MKSTQSAPACASIRKMNICGVAVTIAPQCLRNGRRLAWFYDPDDDSATVEFGDNLDQLIRNVFMAGFFAGAPEPEEEPEDDERWDGMGSR